jgi:hypothetical protein
LGHAKIMSAAATASPQKTRVFVSSTTLDLQDERRALKDALERMRGVEFVGMESWEADRQTPLEVSVRNAAECDVYVGIVANRYGHVDPATHLSRILAWVFRGQDDGSGYMFQLENRVRELHLTGYRREPKEQKRTLHAAKTKPTGTMVASEYPSRVVP